MSLASFSSALARAGVFRSAAGLRSGAARQQLTLARQQQQQQRVAPFARSLATATAKSSSGFNLYNVVFASNARYILFVVTGAAIGEIFYGFIGDSIWEMNNRGKLYHHIDWSKWESIYVEEEEEDEEEDDE
ncbi:Cytochrome b-c1 complex subunit 9 [Hondaea fermentalgiana]|uniref:Cytochrome b-c1 complex subunit 9 n=1 Tax=Hondaea fermentalgiana TaxID=2315210 RepID=A0A2R5GWS3_9STRA|nr:Cytochrome b-c1 complex subunit 9 [Hondaea fermentalgiana]|eukprot:GBG32384.1 Cytochrome b-c1 complex subunit 9 [Hondaea fermentalgiana]